MAGNDKPKWPEQMPSGGEALRLIALATEAIISSDNSLIAALDRKPNTITTAQWVQNLISAATFIEVPFNEIDLRNSAKPLIEADSVDTHLVNFGTFASGVANLGKTPNVTTPPSTLIPATQPSADLYDPEESSGPIDQASEIGQKISALKRDISAIGVKDIEGMEWLKLDKIEKSLQKIGQEILAVDEATYSLPTALHMERQRYQDILWGNLAEEIDGIENRIWKRKLNIASGPSAGLKGQSTGRKVLPGSGRQRSENSGPSQEPGKTRPRKAKFTRRKGKDGK